MKDEEESEETKQESKNQGSNNRGMIQWNTEEKKLFIDCLKKHGRDWDAIAEAFPNKTDKQCRNYFQNYKHKLNLMQYLSNNTSSGEQQKN